METEEENVAIAERVSEISVLKPEWDDIIVIRVDVEKLPLLKRQEYMSQTAKAMKPLFPNNKLVIISGKTTVTLEKDSDLGPL
jgi:hypothetical protein